VDANVFHTCHLILVHETLTKGCTMPYLEAILFIGVWHNLLSTNNNQQQPITADGHFLPKQQATLIDEIWYWQTITITWCFHTNMYLFRKALFHATANVLSFSVLGTKPYNCTQRKTSSTS